MAKSLFRIKARELRKQGISVKRIATSLRVSRSSVSLWVRDVVLTVDQLNTLKRAEEIGRAKGHLKNALLHRERRLLLVEQAKQEGIQEIGKLTKRELLMIGLALYWGEGGKTNKRVELCNSDIQMIKLFLYWLEKCFGVNKRELQCYVGINIIHQKRDLLVKQYWSKLMDIPLDQFRKTSFKKSLSKKVYENEEAHYGTLSIRVSKSTNLNRKIMGLIEALRISMLQ